MKLSSNKKCISVLAALGLMFLSGCATTSQTPEQSAVQRATERWDLISAGDLANAYYYLSPGYRTSVSSLDWQRRILTQRVRWLGSEVNGAECEEALCKVSVTYSYAIYGALPGASEMKSSSTIDENWILSDGQWYYLPKK